MVKKKKWRVGFEDPWDEKDKPVVVGVYEVRDRINPGTREVEVYEHEERGLCIFNENGGDMEDDCHFQIRDSCLTFIRRLRDGDGSMI